MDLAQMELEAHRPDRARNGSAASDTVTPVCLLTGFLGAGKTFLLADLLAHPPAGLRVQAIVNDLGSLPFDPTLVAAQDSIRVELTNGCGCCERTVDLAAVLGELGADPDCDLIVLEASGAADPLGLAQVVAADATLALDRIVAVVSAAQLDGRSRVEPVASMIERQIDSAHSVVLSGCDLVSDEVADAALDGIVERAPGRPVERSSPSGAGEPRAAADGAARGEARPAGAVGVHRELHVVTVTQRARAVDGGAAGRVRRRSNRGSFEPRGAWSSTVRRASSSSHPQSIEIVDGTPGPPRAHPDRRRPGRRPTTDRPDRPERCDRSHRPRTRRNAMKVSVNGVRLHFDVDGQQLPVGDSEVESRPTLIVLHGAPGISDHTAFKPDFAALNDVAQVVYLDLRGAGRSDDDPDGEYSLEGMGRRPGRLL